MLTTYIHTEYADIAKRNKVQILHFQQTVHKQKKKCSGQGGERIFEICQKYKLPGLFVMGSKEY